MNNHLSDNNLFTPNHKYSVKQNRSPGVIMFPSLEQTGFPNTADFYDKLNEQLPHLHIGDAFVPTSPLKHVSAYACTLQEVTFEYTFYCFGAKTSKNSPAVSAKSVSKDV